MNGPAQILWIPGPLPGQNEMLNAHGFGGGGRGNRYAKVKKKWTDDIALLARVRKLRPLDCCRLRFIWHERHRQRNPDNIAAGKKLVIDGLVKARVLSNDGWYQVAAFSDEWIVSSSAGVLVVIEPEVRNRSLTISRFAQDAMKAYLGGHGAHQSRVAQEDEGEGPDHGG